MQANRFEVEGPVLLTPKAFADDRGAFSETYSKRAFAEFLGERDFVQDNQSLSRRKGTIRGLHFQLPPAAQAKLVRVIRGAILDVAVDLRPHSPTYKAHVAVELSAANRAQLLVPAGFAHGFCTLEDDTEVIYKVDAYYSAEHDRGIFWNDPDLGLAWPVDPEAAVLSEKDARAPRLSEIAPPFEGWGK